jgi:cadmium resistance protein CadD (predicted permease)
VNKPAVTVPVTLVAPVLSNLSVSITVDVLPVFHVIVSVRVLGSQTVAPAPGPFEGCERASRCFTLTVYTQQQGVGG